MRKRLAVITVCFFVCSVASAQLMVAKVLGKNAGKYGIGYGLFASLDIPIIAENQAIRIEVGELLFFPAKGESFFTSTGDAIGGGSFRAGYKYVFSETQAGFYLLPTVGCGGVVPVLKNESEAETYWGLATAIEGGYSIAVGANGLINLGLKYEYDFGNQGVSLQTLGFKVSYSFGLFGRNNY